MSAEEYLQGLLVLKRHVRESADKLYEMSNKAMSPSGIDYTKAKVKESVKKRDPAIGMLEQEQKVLREHELYLIAVKTARSKINQIDSQIEQEILTEIYIFGRLTSDIVKDMNINRSMFYRLKDRAIKDLEKYL